MLWRRIGRRIHKTPSHMASRMRHLPNFANSSNNLGAKFQHPRQNLNSTTATALCTTIFIETNNQNTTLQLNSSQIARSTMTFPTEAEITHSKRTLVTFSNQVSAQITQPHHKSMPSHLQRTHIGKGKPLPEGLSLTHVRSDDHADNQAGEAATRQVLDRNVATNYFYRFSKTRSFRKRFMDIVHSLHKRPL